MKPVCPHCQSSSVYEVTDDTNHSSNEPLFAPTVLMALGVSLCRSSNLHPVVGVIASTALATMIELTQSETALPMLVNQQYRCDDCSHVFTAFK